MNKIQMSLIALSLGLLPGNSSAQETRWHAAPGPANVDSSTVGVSLGRPTPLVAGSPFTPPTIVRGARPADYERRPSYVLQREQGTPLDPRIPMPFSFLPDIDDMITRPAQAVQPLPNKDAIVDIDTNGKVRVQQPESLLTQPKKSKEPTQPKKGATQAPGEGVPIIDEDIWSGLPPTPRIYARGEWLLWGARGMNLPVLATTSDANVPQFSGTGAPVAGVLGLSTTRTIFGDSNVLGGIRSGARFTLGCNLDPCGFDGFEATFFFLARHHDNARFSSDTFPVLARPFFNINLGIQDRELITSPGLGVGDPFAGTGSLNIEMSTMLLGAELNKRRLLLFGDNFRVSGLCGFRYLDLNDRLRITEETIFQKRILDPTPPNPILFDVGDRNVVFDRFDTQNRFYGGQLGFDAEMRRGRWSAEARVKLALGCVRQTVDIEGSQTKTSKTGAVQNSVGGLLALSTNIGSHSQTRFGIVPEVGLKIGYDVTDNVRVFVGYDFLYWNSVLRPGDQIDTALDVRKIPNSGGNFLPPATDTRPRVPFVTSSYWAQGVNVGVEVRY